MLSNPTQKHHHITSTIRQTFHEAQQSLIGHKKMAKSLIKITEQSLQQGDGEEFIEAILHCFNAILQSSSSRKGKDDYASDDVIGRSLKFFKTYITLLPPSTTSPIIESIIIFSLTNLSSKEKMVRKNLLTILAHSLNVLDELSNEILLSYREHVSKHLYDREAIVRVEAIIGMSRLQGMPLNPADDEVEGAPVMSVGDAFVEILSNDPNPECRKMALLQLEVDGGTVSNAVADDQKISSMLERRRDTSPLVRRALFNKKICSVVASATVAGPSSSDSPNNPLKPSLLKAKHYDSLFREGLSDHDSSVRSSVKSCLFGPFINEVAEGNLIRLLLSFDSLLNRSLCEATLLSFYHMAEQQDSAKTLFTEFPLVYLQNLTPETALAMRVYLQFRMNLYSADNCKPVDITSVFVLNNNTSLFQPSDMLPPLTEIVSVLADLQRRLIVLSSTDKDVEEMMEVEFCIEELLMTILLLGSDVDEVGYRSLEQLVMGDMLPNLGIKENLFDLSLLTMRVGFNSGFSSGGVGGGNNNFSSSSSSSSSFSDFHTFLNQCLPLIQDFSDLFKTSTDASMESLTISDGVYNNNNSNNNNNNNHKNDSTSSKNAIKMSWRVAAQVRSLKLIARAVQMIPQQGRLSEGDQLLISDLLEQFIIPSINSDYSSVQTEGLKVLCGCAIRLGRRDFAGGNNLIREYLPLMKEFVEHSSDCDDDDDDRSTTGTVALQFLFDSFLIDPSIYQDVEEIIKKAVITGSTIGVEGMCKILLTKKTSLKEDDFSMLLSLALKEFVLCGGAAGGGSTNCNVQKSQQILSLFFSRFICKQENRLLLAKVIPSSLSTSTIDDHHQSSTVDVLVDLMMLDELCIIELALSSLWTLMSSFKVFHSKTTATKIAEQRELSFLSVLSIKAVTKCKSTAPETRLVRKEILVLIEQAQRIMSSLFYSSVKKTIFNQFSRAISTFNERCLADNGNGGDDGGEYKDEQQQQSDQQTQQEQHRLTEKIQSVLGGDLLRDFKKSYISL